MSIYSWGTSKNGETGSGEFEDVLDPAPLEFLKGKIIRQISCGEQHSLAVTDHGALYVWGRGREGELGNGTNTHKSAKPIRVQSLRQERIVFATCGYYHNLAVTDTGRLYQWGKLYKHDADVKSFGMEVNLPGMNVERRAKLVSKSHQSYYAADVNMSEVEESDKVTNFGTFVAYLQKTPELVSGLIGKRVVHAAGGYSFSMAVTEDGELYAWGFNDKFQLGLGHRFNQAAPVRVKGPLEGVRVVKVAAGQQHCMALTDQGEVYSWGLGVFGQLGHGVSSDAHRPTKIVALARDRLEAAGFGPVVQIVCGSHHSLALTRDGSVFTWGSSEYGQQGGREGNFNDWASGERGHAHSTTPTLLHVTPSRGAAEAANPLRYTSDGHVRVVHLACGHLFNFALSVDGDLFSWGWGTSGALGHGNRRVQLVPIQVQKFRGEPLTAVAAGGKHALAINAGSASTFAFDFKPFINSTAYSDLSFRLVDAQKPTLIHAHRVIVFSRCPYLRALVAANSRYVRNANEGVELRGVKPHVFLALLAYLYTDHLKCPSHLLGDLNRLAGKYRLPRLQQLCTRMLLQNAISPSTFRSDMLRAVNESEYADLRLKLDDGTSVFAHRVLLAARCDYFKTIFECNFKEKAQAELPLPALDLDTLLTVLQYIYAGDEESVISETRASLVDTLVAADRLLLDDLKQICEGELENTLQNQRAAPREELQQQLHETYSSLLEIADKFSAPRLKRVCLEGLTSTDQWPLFRESRSLVALGVSSPSLLREIDFLCMQKKLTANAGEVMRCARSVGVVTVEAH